MFGEVATVKLRCPGRIWTWAPWAQRCTPSPQDVLWRDLILTGFVWEETWDRVARWVCRLGQRFSSRTEDLFSAASYPPRLLLLKCIMAPG